MKSIFIFPLVAINAIVFAQQPKPATTIPNVKTTAKSATSTVLNDATLFTYGGNKVSVKEFLSVYKKNNTNKSVDYSEKSLRDYLNLYENFKLKVTEGRAEKLDTLPNLKNELTNYRKQLSKSYLMDKEVLDRMYKEAYNRSLWELHVAHIMVKLPADAPAKDTLEAYNKIMKLYENVTTGKQDFATVARESSEDASAKNNSGDVGYITSLQTFYPFENVAYSLQKAGDVSKPVRTKVGYHILKLLDKRATRGQVQVQHILVSVARAAKPETVAEGKARIDHYYALLKSGKISFDALAKDSSDDKVSAVNAGKLPWFGTGKMVQEFEDQAFKLAVKGTFSEPFRTDYGFHIIKLLDKRQPQSFDKDKDDLKKMVDKDARADNAKAVFISGVKKDYHFSINQNNYNEFRKGLDSSLLKNTFHAVSVMIDLPLISLDNKNYTTRDFATYLESTQRMVHKTGTNSGDLSDRAFQNWSEKICSDLAENKLDKKYPEFKTLMDEYGDGIILFDITDKNVWSKAVNDTTGLKIFYKEHQSKYNWQSRLDATIYRCANEKSAEAVKEMLAKNIPADTIKKLMNRVETKGGVSFENGKYEKLNNKVIDKCKWETGVQSVTVDDIPCVVQVHKILEPSPKQLEEARGYVIADYQEQLEKTWMANIKAKYPIVEDEKVFKSLVK